MRIPDGWAAWIGLPYLKGGRPQSLAEAARGVDCIGLFLLGVREKFGASLPDYDGPLWGDDADALLTAAAAFAARFRVVQTGAEWRAGVSRERAGDAVLIRIKGAPIHIGLIVAPPFMLHIDSDLTIAGSVIEDYRERIWRSRVHAFYRAEPAP